MGMDMHVCMRVCMRVCVYVRMYVIHPCGRFFGQDTILGPLPPVLGVFRGPQAQKGKVPENGPVRGGGVKNLKLAISRARRGVTLPTVPLL